MTRADLAAWLGERYGIYLDQVGRAATDTPGNLKAPIDDALLALGIDDADLVTATTTTSTEAVDWRTQGAYRLLAQIVRDLATSFDISGKQGSLKLSQIRAAAETDLTAARAVVLARFGTIDVVVSEEDGEVGPDLVIDGNFLLSEPLVWR